MPLRRTPPHGVSSPNIAKALCGSDPNLSSPPTILIAESNAARDLASSEPNITQRKRKRGDEHIREEMLEMFSTLKKEQDEKFNTLMQKVESGIKKHTEQNTSILTSIDFLAQKYDEMTTKLNKLVQKSSQDEKYIQLLEARLESMERRLQSSCLEVRNIPKKNGETKTDLLNIVTKIGEALNVPIQPSEVRDVYRINTKNENNKPIVAQLCTVPLRDNIIKSVKDYNKKYTTTKFNTSNLKIEGPSKPIFISEGLTTQAKKLFFHAREFAKENNYKYCWTTRGVIYLRRVDGGPLLRLNKESDMEQLKKK